MDKLTIQMCFWWDKGVIELSTSWKMDVLLENVPHYVKLYHNKEFFWNVYFHKRKTGVKQLQNLNGANERLKTSPYGISQTKNQMREFHVSKQTSGLKWLYKCQWDEIHFQKLTLFLENRHSVQLWKNLMEVNQNSSDV